MKHNVQRVAWVIGLGFNLILQSHNEIFSVSDIAIKTRDCKVAIIFGVTGQDGAYLSELLLDKGYQVYGIIRRTSYQNTPRLTSLLRNKSIETKNKLTYVYGDLTDYSCVARMINIVKPDEIYNLAAQSHVKISFEKPEYTSQVNAIGTLNILEAIRNAGLTNKTRFYQASTSEMFGKVQTIPQNESTPFYPRSPYAVSKLYAHWMTINYREAYGMFACNGILFNHESPHRGENFVTRVISQGVAKIKLGLAEQLKVGNLNAKRDWGYAKDYVYAMWLMLQQETPDDYVIATGETHSVREFIELAFQQIGIELEWQGSGTDEIGINKKTGKTMVVIDPTRFRPTEVDYLIGDSSKARLNLGWKNQVTFAELVKILVDSDVELLSLNNELEMY